MKIGKVIIVINHAKAHARPTAIALKEVLTREGVAQEWLATVPLKHNLYEALATERLPKADLIIACGGDGTLLQTAHRFRGAGIPILGINIGYLGFVTSVDGERVAEEMHRILRADFVISQRTALDLVVQNAQQRVTGWALNDAVIIRGDNPRLVSISARVGQRALTNYRCDGLIVATPTGSTAYSLAAGGPIISPECNVLVVTPICPQSLTNRSVVVNSTEPIEMRLEAHSGRAVVQVDGMTLAKATPNTTIIVESSRDSVPIAFLPEINYYDTLGKKLLWRGDGFPKPT